ncbi:hypothetical protein BJ684DRAFT_16729 [Piptocephalis cylindrospora]|uniref:Uncharacterized protein n=1 Tax=Piptocephalis cylindrospora TaxID=1907219 RepID=A0A4P9Y2L2_9FUNG|nr:hypothetical protein BJ684DRAFT_16729 [Piptocephalis cylindrospora]|eukprot:RKP12822.1 hypothetical protein BJ684DRAFT_16729 [Piptocephalis cylindrospora]
MMILPTTALLLALSASTLAHPSSRITKGDFDTHLRPSMTYEHSHYTSKADLFNPEDTKSLAHCSKPFIVFLHEIGSNKSPDFSLVSKENMELKRWYATFTDVLKQLEVGLKKIDEMAEKIPLLDKKRGFRDLAGMRDALSRSTHALPDLWKVFQNVYPGIHTLQRYGEPNKRSIPEQVNTLAIMLQGNLNSITMKDYLHRNSINQHTFRELVSIERLLTLLPRAYHTIRVVSFLRSITSRYKVSPLSKSSSSSLRSTIRDNRECLEALKVPSINIGVNQMDIQTLDDLLTQLDQAMQGERPSYPENIHNSISNYEIWSANAAKGTLEKIYEAGNNLLTRLKDYQEKIIPYVRDNEPLPAQRSLFGW